jgi:nitrate reductase gamma subunit
VGAALLEFARGPALTVSLAILFAGVAWRLVGIFRLAKKADLSEPRSTALVSGALRGIVTRMWPRREFGNSPTLATSNGYVYHVGLALVVFGYSPHVAFIERLTGLSWRALPEAVFYVAAGLTIVSLFIALLYRLTDPVLKLLSNFDDYFSWFIVMLALLTGMLVVEQSFKPAAASSPNDPLLIAFHLFAVELLFIWLPFGKLSHAFLVFVSRGTTGAAFARKGARP